MRFYEYVITYGIELKFQVKDAIQDLEEVFRNIDKGSKEWYTLDCILHKLTYSERIVIVCFSQLANCNYKELDQYFDADYQVMRRIISKIRMKVKQYVEDNYKKEKVEE